MFPDDVERCWGRFAERANRWANLANSLSPDSPDFETRLKAEWQKRKVAERFEELRKVMDEG